jgi:cold shock CspA family protein
MSAASFYFHRDAVTNARFDDLKQGDTVHYVEEAGDAGPTAVKVRLAAARD